MAYTGPFPHTNAGLTTAIIVKSTSFTGNLDNTGTIAPGNIGSGTGILVENNSTINGEISNAGTINVVGNGILVGGTTNTTDNSNVIKGIVNGGSGFITAASGQGIAVAYETKFTGGITNFGFVSAGNGAGLAAISVSTFTGGIDNFGTVDARDGVDIDGVSDFSGGVTNTGTIEAGTGILVEVAAIFAGNIINKGELTANISSGIVVSTVDFATGGTFSGTIDNSGAISARQIGINIGHVGLSRFSGGISNSGRITATSDDGIAITDLAPDGNFAGNISNSGAIKSANDLGIRISDIATAGTATFAGTVANTGAVSAKDTGIRIDGVGTTRFAGGITNSGAITAATEVGIAIVTVAADGTFAGSIVNAGSIQSLVRGLVIAGVGASSFDSVEIAGTGHHAKTSMGGITNSGAITAASASGIFIHNVAGSGTFIGNILNTGAVSAVNGNGLSIADVGSSDFSGGITNSGAIAAGLVGIDVTEDAAGSSATFKGAIVNTGAVSAATGINVERVGGSSFSGGISNSGRITAKTDAIAIFKDVESGNFTGNVSNSGALSAGAMGIIVESVASGGSATFSGTIVNTGAVSVDDFGIFIDNVGASRFSGGISNRGEIAATSGLGILIANVAKIGDFIGNISNGGAISAEAVGIDISAVASGGSALLSGTIVNTGAISAVGTGILIDNVGSSRFSGGISNRGDIAATSGFGIRITKAAETGDFTGNISNGGAISAEAAGIDISAVASGSSATFSGTIINTGAVSADDIGIFIENVGGSRFSGGISNSGEITAISGQGLLFAAVAEHGNFIGKISNGGSISAEFLGIDISAVATSGSAAFSGTIVNTGAVSAGGAGFLIGNVGGSRFSGGISNSGKITATGGGGIIIEKIAKDGNFTGNISNGGAISASNLGIDITTVASSGSATFSGAIINTGAVSAVGTGIKISKIGESHFSGGIINDGKIVSTSDVGIGIVSAAVSGNFSGSIVNAGSVSAHLAGMIVDDVGLTLTGGITNSGVISSQAGGGMLIEGLPSLVGDVVNAATATIAAPTGIMVVASSIAGAVIDAGTILGAGVGVEIAANARISAAKTALDITGPTLAGGVTNLGLIEGKVGIALTSAHGVNVLDGGTIIGSGGTAVELTGGDDFTLGSGYVVSGTVVGAAGDALQLGGAAAASFNLASVGTQYKNFTTFNVVDGAWTVSGSGGHWNVDAGGDMILSGGDVLSNSNVYAGGTAVISSGATFETTSGGAAAIYGHVTNSGTIVASGGVIEFAAATVGGSGSIDIGNGIVRVQGPGNENVNFLSDGSGGLQISDDHATSGAYTGMVMGFGGSGHANHSQYIDLTSVTFVSGGTITGSYNSGTHVLTVTSGGSGVAVITISGSYTTADFHFSSGVDGTVEITDPAVHAGGHQEDHVGHSANLGLLANYIANFGAEAHGNLLISSVGLIEPVPPLLVQPHR